MPAHLGSGSPSTVGRSYNNPRPASPSRVALAILGVVSVGLAVYFAESYPKRVVHSLPRVYQNALPYDLYALEPYISAETMDYHYNKHDYGYDKKLQSLVNGTEMSSLSLMEILELNSSQELPAGVYNNAGQLMNHNLFWDSMTPNRNQQYPKGLSSELEKQIIQDFGSLDAFAKEFANKATAWFGSGWTFVAFNRKTKLIEILNTPNGNYLSPPKDYVVLFNLDVWEHAYYIDYRNRRDEYIRYFWQVVNWEFASDNFYSKANP